MQSNKFFTILIVPEKTQKVRRIIVPNYIFKGGVLACVVIVVLAAIMVLDYANVMNQITENKQLKVENRQLKQAVQVFKNKMVTMEHTLDRVKTFATKLRIITNIAEQVSPLDQNLSPVPPIMPGVLPLSTPTMPPVLPQSEKSPNNHSQQSVVPKNESSMAPLTSYSQTDLERDTDEEKTLPLENHINPESEMIQLTQITSSVKNDEHKRAKRLNLLAALMSPVAEVSSLTDADTSMFVKAEFEKLDAAYEELSKFSIEQEQDVQFILERLSEKRALLAGTPTLLPTLGYITSEYGIRISPYDGRKKMHEGIDIANRYGAEIISPADGMVSFAGVKPGYGKLLVIDHGNGIETAYAHNAAFYVKATQKIKRGQRVAAVGNTGHSTGPHCHYEVRARGLPVDPCWYVLDHPAICRQR